MKIVKTNKYKNVTKKAIFAVWVDSISLPSAKLENTSGVQDLLKADHIAFACIAIVKKKL